LHVSFKENGIVMWFLTLSHWTSRESFHNVSRSPKGTKFQTDHATYDNLARRQKSVNDALVMHAYDKPATWSEALKLCKNRGMKEGTFKNIDYKLKSLSVIREMKYVMAQQGSYVKSALSRRRELLIKQIEAATSREEPSQLVDPLNRNRQGTGTLADELFWATLKHIEKDDEAFKGLPRNLEPRNYFGGGGFNTVRYEEKVGWLWEVQNWLADVVTDG